MSKNKVPIIKIENNVDYTELVTWEEMESKSTKYIKRFSEKQNRTVVVEYDGDWVLLAIVADIHLGNYGTDFAAARRDAEMIGNCPFAIGVGAGDYLDNFIRAKILEPLINSTTPPKQQLMLLKDYIRFFKGRLMLIISGNHDRWSKEVSGLDFLAPLARENKIQYSPDVFHINVKAGKVIYEICIRHQYKFNSSINMTHTVKQMFKNGDRQFDIGIVAHHHEPAMEDCFIQDRHVVAIRPGTYKVGDTFSRKIGHGKGRTVMPCVALNVREKRMVSFWSLRDGIEFVERSNEHGDKVAYKSC
jgi:hypothetical protein